MQIIFDLLSPTQSRRTFAEWMQSIEELRQIVRDNYRNGKAKTKAMPKLERNQKTSAI